jgi:HEAT repeat protein
VVERVPDVRVSAVRQLGVLRAPEALGVLVDRLRNDPELVVRAGAAIALGKIGSDEAVPHLLAALDDPAPQVRWRSTLALGRIGDRRATSTLLELLRSDDRSLRACAADALGRLGDPAVADAIWTASKEEPSFWKRRFYKRAVRRLDRQRLESRATTR